MEATHDVLVVGAGWRACARPSRRTTRAPTSRSSRRSTRCAATPARPRAGSTPRSGTRRRTTPRSTPTTRSRARTISATRTRSRSSATRRPDDVYQLEHWGAVFSRTEDGRIAQRPFGAAGEPRTAYAADITGHVLIHVLYEQVMKREIFAYEEFFAWKLVVDDDRCQGVIAWDLLNGGLKTIGAKTVILATGGAGRLYKGTTNAYACTGDGMAMALRVGRASEGHGDDAVPPDDALSDGSPDHRGLPRRGRLPAQRRGRALPQATTRRTRWSSRAETSSRAPSRRRSTRAGASTEAFCSTFATWGPRRSSSACTARASWR